MDDEWAIAELDAFLALSEYYRPPDPPGVANFSDTSTTRAPSSQVVAAAQVVEQILDRALPDWRTSLPTSKRRWSRHREAATRAIVQLRRAKELSLKLGENAPRLAATSMHPWVWQGARSLWQTGHYREAVRAASVQVNAEVQNKLGRKDASETDLFHQAFSDDAPAMGKPRLRPPDDDDGKTARSFRRGIRAFAEGCFSSIRNPLAHELGDLDESQALEQLAAFSILARWSDAADVISAGR